MGQINTNIITLALKNKLVGATLTFEDDSTIEVADYECDPKTDMFVIQDTLGNTHPVHASKMGLADNTDLTKPTGIRQKAKKLK